MSNSDIRFYLALLWRRIPYVLAAIVIGGAAGVAIALLIPHTYRATAKVVVESAEIPVDMARTTVTETVADQLQLIQQQVTTRKNLLDLVKEFDIYGTEIAQMSSDNIVDDMRSRIDFEQVSLLMNASSSGTSIFSVSFTAGQSQLAADVANKLVSIIINKNANARTDRAGATVEFFKAESARLNGVLDRIEAEILELKKSHQGSLPESLEFRRSQQTALQERLLSLDHEEAALRARRFNVSKMDVSEGGGVLSPEGQSIADLNRSLTEQLAMYSETSPTIVALRTQIARLKNELKEREGKGGPAGKALTGRQIELSEIDTRLKSIGSERETTRNQMSALAATIAATPATEKALNELLRSRDNIQVQYNAAIAKLGEAAAGNRIEREAQGGRFSILEPASPPQKPIGPKRKLIAVAGTAAGFGVGAGLVLLFELLNKTIRRPSDVARVLKAAPLATIPFIQLPRRRRFDAMRTGMRLATVGSLAAFAAMFASVAG